MGYISTGGGAFLEVLEGEARRCRRSRSWPGARRLTASPRAAVETRIAAAGDARPPYQGVVPGVSWSARAAQNEGDMRVDKPFRRRTGAARRRARISPLATRGKISVTPTKPLSNQRDLSWPVFARRGLRLPGDREGPDAGAEYTSRGNLVGVVTNGTAVLGLGDIGCLAGKPVMEGKGCLFKKFAGIDVFDIELAEKDPDKLVEIIAALEPTLGGVNLEDIKAPECFYIEKKLRERMNIPVFHDDQHGTAIIRRRAAQRAGAGGQEDRRGQAGGLRRRRRGHRVPGRDGGPGRARENIFVVDSKGVIREGRADCAEGRPGRSKQRYCQRTERARWPTW